MLQKNDLDLIRGVPGRVVIAYSGGLDSHVLLHLVANLGLSQVSAIHINHGISRHADGWARHCEKVCASLNIPLAIERVTMPGEGNLEANARRARYETFESLLEDEDLLLMAHHQDDQLETMLLNLFRGSGPPGVSGMPARRSVGWAKLLRPLLHKSREDLEQYAATHRLDWIEDESNLDLTFDRNYLRREVLPAIKLRWPGVAEALKLNEARSQDTMALASEAADELLDDLADGDMRIEAKLFVSLPRTWQRVVLRRWLENCGSQLQPSQRALDQWLVSAANETGVAQLVSLPVELRRYQSHYFCLPIVPTEPVWQRTIVDVYQGLTVPYGFVSADRTKARGVHLPDGARVEIDLRRGGEEMKLGQTRTLKNLLQENHIPSFLREVLPLIYVNGSLAAVCGIPAWQIPTIVSAEFAGQGADCWEFHWQVANASK